MVLSTLGITYYTQMSHRCLIMIIAVVISIIINGSVSFGVCAFTLIAFRLAFLDALLLWSPMCFHCVTL